MRRTSSVAAFPAGRLFCLVGILGLSGLITAGRARAAEAPPPPPWKGGFAVDGTLGTYAPVGKLKRITSPGPWARLTAGWEFTKWLGVFVAFDAAFLSTDRASPPPGERGYILWGFGGGVRFSLPLGTRWRIPARFEIGAHKADDNGVLATYSFNDAQSFGVSLGAMTGLEWRASSRHFGVALEGGVRTDSSMKNSVRAETPLAILAGVIVRYTL